MYSREEKAALTARLDALSEEEYRRFNLRLNPGAESRWGVRIPLLRQLAREIAAGDWRDYLELDDSGDYTERMLTGLVTAYARCSQEEKRQRTAAFLARIDNWSVCDTFCSTLKCVKQDMPGWWSFLQPLYASSEEYTLRFAVVLTMDCFLTEEYIDAVLLRLAAVRHGGYYVKMAVAWALSFCFIKFRDKTLPLFASGDLDGFINNKAIQKCRESYRVCEADKAMLCSFKKTSVCS